VTISAAVLAAAAATGILLSEPPVQAAPNGSSTVAMVDAVRDSGSVASRNAPRAAASAARVTPGQAPTAPASVQAPTAPASAQAPAPAQAPATASPSPVTPAPPPAPPSSKVLNYQFQLQPNYYYCGPAATRIALSARGRVLTQDEVARQLGTTTGGTDSAMDTTRALNNVLGTSFYETRAIPGLSATPAQMDQLQADVVHAISNGYAMVANIVGSSTDTTGNWHGYGGGHYVAIVGYSDNGRTVKIADPANPNGDGTYWVTTINMAQWMVNRGYSF
jgi:hypothetical protein